MFRIKALCERLFWVRKNDLYYPENPVHPVKNNPSQAER